VNAAHVEENAAGGDIRPTDAETARMSSAFPLRAKPNHLPML
jgi:hypothetical protein